MIGCGCLALDFDTANNTLNISQTALRVLIFAPPRQPGQLPALIHALPAGK